MVFSRAFRGKRRDGPPDRVPPGQYLTDDFPVLSAGPDAGFEVVMDVVEVVWETLPEAPGG